MELTPPARKALLTTHVLASVGWVGAVLVYLALGVAAVISTDTTLVRAAYVVMDWAAWVVLIPLAVASLVTGVGVVAHSTGALLLLVAATLLAVYKPTGLTRRVTASVYAHAQPPNPHGLRTRHAPLDHHCRCCRANRSHPRRLLLRGSIHQRKRDLREVGG